MKENRTRTLVEIALMTAVVCVLGPLAIPIGPVPITLGTFAIMLAAYVLGAKCGTIVCALYLLLGAIGLPVFSGFAGGFSKVAGPTGGYLIGYIPLALLTGWAVGRFTRTFALQFIGMVAGIAACYLLGTLWLAHQAQMGFRAALAVGVIPFIPFDLAKAAGAIAIGYAVRTRLIRAGVIHKTVREG